MTTTYPAYGFGTTLALPLDEALERVTAALQEEGFGVLTSIDVQQTLKQKLNVDFEPYLILGVCNPPLAHRALTIEHGVGLLLPCNVVLHRHGETTQVDIADPLAMLGVVANPALVEVAEEARRRLTRVVEHLDSGA